jgi:hypothetical protein
VTNYFAGDIAVEKAHGRKGECNMGGEAAWGQEERSVEGSLKVTE